MLGPWRLALTKESLDAFGENASKADGFPFHLDSATKGKTRDKRQTCLGSWQLPKAGDCFRRFDWAWQNHILTVVPPSTNSWIATATQVWQSHGQDWFFFGKWYSGPLCHLEWYPWSINCAQGYIQGDFEKEAKGRNAAIEGRGISFHVLCDREQRLGGCISCRFQSHWLCTLEWCQETSISLSTRILWSFHWVL